MPVCEKSNEESIGIWGGTYVIPILKCPIRQVCEIKCLTSGETVCSIIVRLVASFLKLNKSVGDFNQMRLNPVLIGSIGESRRNSSQLFELFCSLFHI